ncbi:MAG: nitroreductase family protein [Bacteroidaceae bacterium]|nr:nitroreductase family protein [Bacteroidaceae bacterium]
MTFKELCEQRFSVRKYSEQAVSDDDVQYVLECARLAPSACNLQPWRFVVIKDEGLRAQLKECYDRDWFSHAPLYIVCVTKRDEAWVRSTYDGKHHGDVDIAIAAEHICLAAADRGLGTCWVCNFDAKRCHELLGLAETEEAAVIVPLGHLQEGLEVRPKTRKELTELVEVR